MSLRPLPESAGILDRKDYLFWGATYGLALAAAVLLYAAAFRAVPAGYRFSGFIHSSHDMYSYMAWSRAFSDPGFLVDNPYALTPHPGAYFNLYWFAIGKLMRLTGLPFLPLLYASGVFSGGVMYLAFLAFMRRFLPQRSLAWLAYLLAGFGSGFGWTIFLHSLIPRRFFGTIMSPNDITNPELLPFHDFLAYPHVALSFGLMAFIYLRSYQGVTRNDWRRTLQAGGALLLLGFFHPFHLVTILTVMGLFCLAKTFRNPKRFLSLWPHPIFLGMTAVPPLAYFRFYLLRSPNFRGWATQIVNPTYGLLNTLLGFGPHVVLALLGLVALARTRKCPDRVLFILVWIGAALALALGQDFFPFKSRILQGVIVPMSVLAAIGFAFIVHRFIWGRAPGLLKGMEYLDENGPAQQEVWPPGWRFFLWAVPLVLITMPSHFLVFANQLREIAGKRTLFRAPINSKIIIQDEEMAAFEYLRRNINDDSVIMSSMDTGVALPAYARVRSFIGHFQGTDNCRDRLVLSKSFYWTIEAGEERRQKMEEMGINYVWHGPDETSIGLFDPLGVPYLETVYDNGVVGIYRFVPRRPP